MPSTRFFNAPRVSETVETWRAVPSAYFAPLNPVREYPTAWRESNARREGIQLRVFENRLRNQRSVSREPEGSSVQPPSPVVALRLTWNSAVGTIKEGRFTVASTPKPGKKPCAGYGRAARQPAWLLAVLCWPATGCWPHTPPGVLTGPASVHRKPVRHGSAALGTGVAPGGNAMLGLGPLAHAEVFVRKNLAMRFSAL